MKILCGWELGNELGHLSQMAELTKRFQVQGHQVTLALRDLSRPHFFFKDLKVPILQAPVWQYPVQIDRPVYCLADVLMMKGYLYNTTLHNLVNAWQAMLDLVKPDLVICDYAPSLLLALWNSSIPRVVMGTGFSDPAPGHPLQDWRPNAPGDGVVEAQEKRLLDTVNAALDAQGKPALTFFSDLYRADFTVIKTLPELDLHAALRSGDTYYCVPQSSSDRGAADWLEHPGAKVFAYLSPQHPQWDTLIRVLKQCDGNVFLSCPGDKRERMQAYDAGNFRLNTDVVNMPASLRRADLFVGHGSMGSVAQSLLAGTPVMNFPIQLEQLRNGLNVQQLGAGDCMAQIQSEAAAVAAINNLLKIATFRARAQTLAQHRSGIDSDTAMSVVAQRCMALMGR